MYYVIDKDALFELAKAEISKVADEAYTDDGLSLYDSIILTERDRDTVGDYIDDAVTQFVRREFSVTKNSPYDQMQSGVMVTIPRLEFNVPDFDTAMEPYLVKELNRYITLFVCAAIFQHRRAAVVPEYTNRTQSAMDKAVSILKSRKQPVSQW